jgi:hypothetical protein
MSNTAPTAPRGVEFRLLTIPPTMDGSDAARDFADHVAVRNAVYREISGHDDNSLPPDELLPMYQPDDYQRRHLWLVLEEGRPIGRVGCDIPLERLLAQPAVARCVPCQERVEAANPSLAAPRGYTPGAGSRG